ncbi:MAG: hypothetical protein P4M10_02610 [Verrucomicrobiae bacterium]|nr:hypothetical protein [Verrucomicrobiae bacterium]
MIFRNLKNSPEKLLPVAMAMIAVGLSILTIGIAWPRFSPSLPHMGTDWNDFARGFMYGLAIALEASGLVLALAAATAAKKRKAL